MKLKSLDELRLLLPESERGRQGVLPTQGDAAASNRGHDGKKQEVRIRLDRKGRKGKTVTLVMGLRHNPHTMKEIAHALKEKCGTGGTVKEGNIELQGDQRERAAEELRKMNYIVQ